MTRVWLMSAPHWPWPSIEPLRQGCVTRLVLRHCLGTPLKAVWLQSARWHDRRLMLGQFLPAHLNRAGVLWTKGFPRKTIRSLFLAKEQTQG